jgi:putative peptidoglycan lipid II flippase
MSQMLKSSGAMAAATLTSRVLGMAREIVYLAFMGAGMVSAAFQLAFTIPNLFRRLLGEGALTAAFIPIFKEKEKAATTEEMWRAANAVISGLIAVASIITLVVILGVTLVLAVGHGHFQDRTELLLRLLRIMFPYMLLICLTAVFMGILNARGHFFIPASSAVVMNVVMIASVAVVYYFKPRFGATLDRQVFFIAFSVLVAGVAQALFQLPSLHSEGFRYEWVSPWNDETVRRVVRQMIPGTIGIAAFQINVLVTPILAYLFANPSIVPWFLNAVRLMELPQGVFGISLATYLLPTLAGLAAEKKFNEFRGTLVKGIDHLIFVNLFASVLLCVLAVPIIRLLFEHGRYGAMDTAEAGIALAWLAPGLVSFSLVNILARAFYALGDTKTPMQVSIFCLLLNLAISLAVVWRFRQGGIAAANTATGTVNVCLLYFALRRKLGRLELSDVLEFLPYIIAAAALAGLAAWGATQWWTGRYGHAVLWTRLGEVFLPMTAATVVYGALSLWLKVPSAVEMAQLMRQRLGYSDDVPPSRQ